MLSVCIYSPSEKIWGGGQIYIESLCRFLNENGLDSVIASSEPEMFSCPAIRMPSVSSKIKRLLMVPSFSRVLKARNVSVIVLNDLSSLWLAPFFRLFGFKVVSLLHLYLQVKNSSGFGHGWLEYHFLRFSSRFAHRVLSVNKDNQESLPVPVRFIGNFVPAWFFSEAKKIKKYDLGLISRLSPEKNIPLFIDLVSKLNAISERPITALIVGEGGEEEYIKYLISQKDLQDRIELRGWVDRNDLPYAYDEIKVFAVTSYHEGFATTVLEAHARGIPVITTSSAGFCPEFVLGGASTTGMVFDKKDLVNDTFLIDILKMIDSSSCFNTPCRDKAMCFDEDAVLGKIKSSILALV